MLSPEKFSHRKILILWKERCVEIFPTEMAAAATRSTLLLLLLAAAAASAAIMGGPWDQLNQRVLALDKSGKLETSFVIFEEKKYFPLDCKFEF